MWHISNIYLQAVVNVFDMLPSIVTLKEFIIFNFSLKDFALVQKKIDRISLSSFVLFSCCSRYVAFVEFIHLNDLIDSDI